MKNILFVYFLFSAVLLSSQSLDIQLLEDLNQEIIKTFYPDDLKVIDERIIMSGLSVEAGLETFTWSQEGDQPSLFIDWEPGLKSSEVIDVLKADNGTLFGIKYPTFDARYSVIYAANSDGSNPRLLHTGIEFLHYAIAGNNIIFYEEVERDKIYVSDGTSAGTQLITDWFGEDNLVLEDMKKWKDGNVYLESDEGYYVYNGNDIKPVYIGNIDINFFLDDFYAEEPALLFQIYHPQNGSIESFVHGRDSVNIWIIDDLVADRGFYYGDSLIVELRSKYTGEKEFRSYFKGIERKMLDFQDAKILAHSNNLFYYAFENYDGQRGIGIMDLKTWLKSEIIIDDKYAGIDDAYLRVLSDGSIFYYLEEEDDFYIKRPNEEPFSFRVADEDNYSDISRVGYVGGYEVFMNYRDYNTNGMSFTLIPDNGSDPLIYTDTILATSRLDFISFNEQLITKGSIKEFGDDQLQKLEIISDTRAIFKQISDLESGTDHFYISDYYQDKNSIVIENEEEYITYYLINKSGINPILSDSLRNDISYSLRLFENETSSIAQFCQFDDFYNCLTGALLSNEKTDLEKFGRAIGENSSSIFFVSKHDSTIYISERLKSDLSTMQSEFPLPEIRDVDGNVIPKQALSALNSVESSEKIVLLINIDDNYRSDNDIDVVVTFNKNNLEENSYNLLPGGFLWYNNYYVSGNLLFKENSGSSAMSVVKLGIKEEPYRLILDDNFVFGINNQISGAEETSYFIADNSTTTKYYQLIDSTFTLSAEIELDPEKIYRYFVYNYEDSLYTFSVYSDYDISATFIHQNGTAVDTFPIARQIIKINENNLLIDTEQGLFLFILPTGNLINLTENSSIVYFELLGVIEDEIYLEAWHPQSGVEVFKANIDFSTLTKDITFAKVFGKISFYPNPVRKSKEVFITNYDQIKSIMISDMAGKIIYHRNGKMIDGRLRINVPKPGIYLISSQTKDNKIISGKIMVID